MVNMDMVNDGCFDFVVIGCFHICLQFGIVPA
jgi:hypothetical protein